MTYIDLSVVVNEQTPVYPGDPAPEIRPAGQIEKDGFNDHQVTFGTHLGTHIDAPLHMLADGKSLDQFGVEQFIGPGKLIKIDGKITLAQVAAASIQPGDIVLLWTGMSARYNDPAYFENYPAIPQDVAECLAGKQIKMVGVDTCSVDHGEFVAHRILLGHNILLIENLVNLGQLEGKAFTVYALPLKLQLDGAPARVIAHVVDS
jgi:kynurenine formamidase